MIDRADHRWHPWRALDAAVDVTKASLEDLDGYWEPGEPLTIVLARDLGQAGRRCTLTHELVHMERGVVEGDGSKEEHAVDDEAARRLIPTEDLVDKLLWSLDEQELAEDLWVDVATVRARLRGLTPGEKDDIDRRIRAAEGRMP